jgi:hypothetical protein
MKAVNVGREIIVRRSATTSSYVGNKRRGCGSVPADLFGSIELSPS